MKDLRRHLNHYALLRLAGKVGTKDQEGGTVDPAEYELPAMSFCHSIFRRSTSDMEV